MNGSTEMNVAQRNHIEICEVQDEFPCAVRQTDRHMVLCKLCLRSEMSRDCRVAQNGIKQEHLNGQPTKKPVRVIRAYNMAAGLEQSTDTWKCVSCEAVTAVAEKHCIVGCDNL